MSAKKSRSYEKQFEVYAPAEAVWKAITEGEELTRWFCERATCAPGVGGEQHVDWGGGAKGTQRITIWGRTSISALKPSGPIYPKWRGQSRTRLTGT